MCDNAAKKRDLLKRVQTLKNKSQLPDGFYVPFGHDEILEVLDILEALLQ